MKTREIADALNVDVSVIQKRVKALFPEKVQQGVVSDFNEEEVQLIKNYASRGNCGLEATVRHQTYDIGTVLQSSLTEIDQQLIIAKAMQIIQGKIKHLQEENKRLDIQLEQNKQWYTVKRVMLLTGEKFDWRPIKNYSLASKIDIKKVFDQNYGFINAYHIDAWRAVYPEVDIDG